MDALYEQFYFVTWVQSRIVDENLFYKKLKAIVPSRTKVYGGQKPCVDPSEPRKVCYHAVIALPFVPRRERYTTKWGHWPAWAELKDRLVMVIRQKNPETGEYKCVRDTERINIQVPSRWRSGYEDLPKFFENVQAYIEKDDNKLLFGNRIDPRELQVGPPKPMERRGESLHCLFGEIPASVLVGQGRTDLVIEGNRPAAPSVDQVQAALTEDQMDDSVQNRTPADWHKWIHYVVAWLILFSGFAVIIAGMTSTHENGWGLAFIVCYVCWTLAVSLYLYLNLLSSGAFVKHCASHLACCAVTLYFFAAALHISSTDLPMYIPMSVNLGLLLSIGLQQISLPTKMQMLSYLGLGYSYAIVQQEPILPLVEPSSRHDRIRRQEAGGSE